MRRRVRLAATIAILAALLGLVVWAVPRNHAETDALILDWHSTGRPQIVEGVVLDSNQAPMAGECVNIDDDSGGQGATTDADGRFSVHLGEPEVRGLDVRGRGLITWGIVGFGGVDASKGVEFRIIVKNRRR